MRLEPLKRGTKTKPGEGDTNRKKAEEISTNAEGKCRNLKRRQKRYQGKCRRSRQNQKTKGRPRPKEKKQSSEYGRVRGAHMSRVRVDLGFIRGRGLSSNHSGDDGGTQTGIRSEVKCMSGWEPNIGSKTRNANMIQKVEGSRRNCHGSS